MSRYTTQHSYDHKCEKRGDDWYVISWTFDRYYEGSRLRWPVTMQRETDEVGARRFCAKHDIEFPDDSISVQER